MPLKHAGRTPVSTYRVQLHSGFNFYRLAEIVPYLKKLGVSDVYCSPIFTATPGSTHGYDVSDYRTINQELGGDEGLDHLHAALRREGMGLLLDFVPNHMGVAGSLNAWWLDVLECGRYSPHARFFDIHWSTRNHSPRVLLPMLGDHYGKVLEEGALKLRFAEGCFDLAYGESIFPIAPETYPELLRAAFSGVASDTARTDLSRLVEELEALPKPELRAPTEEKEARAMRVLELKAKLRELISSDPSVEGAIRAVVQMYNGQVGSPDSFNNLDRLLARQHYRLARWKTSSRETNYRRFFAIDTLVGMRMERDEVFHQTHGRLAELLAEGKVTGLRIDHIDGLWDPERYLGQLQELARGKDGEPFYVLVEKIVEGDEKLPGPWLTHGTTGYEFASDVAQLLVEPRNAQRFDRVHAEAAGQAMDYEQTVYDSKRLVMDEMFANAINSLARQLNELFYDDRHWRDLTQHELAVAIREIIAQLTVYRTYRRPEVSPSEEDLKTIHQACDHAIARNPRNDPEPFNVIRSVLTGEYPPAHYGNDVKARYLGWTMAFQQYTGAVMAKAVEDTTFYVFNRLVGLNEVGGDPGSFGRPMEEFHHRCKQRQAWNPLTQLNSSTHDTKFSEDARARLYALSEIPDEWEDWLKVWKELNARHKTKIGEEEAPDGNEEYRLYQSLLAAWPLDGVITDEFVQRIRSYMRKSLSEAKVHTTDVWPNVQWVDACDRFVQEILETSETNPFLEHMAKAAGRLARFGMVNSLSMVILKSTTPGVPDFYQGNEFFDFSLVDPDNRRPVDFTSCIQSLNTLDTRSWADLLVNWKDGAIKQRLSRDLLRLRRDHAVVFNVGEYVPLKAEGRYAEHVIAYLRRHESGTLLVVIPRWVTKLGCPPMGLVWDDTSLVFDQPHRWTNVSTGEEVALAGRAALSDLLCDLPFLVLFSPGRDVQTP